MVRLLVQKREGGVAFPLNIGKLFNSGWPIFLLSRTLFGKDFHEEKPSRWAERWVRVEKAREGGRGGGGGEGLVVSTRWPGLAK